MKKCNRCKVEKHEDQFIHGKHKCLSCYQKCKEYYKQNREKEITRAKKSLQNRPRSEINETKRAGIRKNPVSYLLWSVKSRAKREGIQFDLTHDDIVIPEVCPVLGIPLKISDGYATGSSPSVDRFDPSRGYVKGNVNVISYRANTIKSDASLEELQKVIDYMESGNVSHIE